MRQTVRMLWRKHAIVIAYCAASMTLLVYIAAKVTW